MKKVKYLFLVIATVCFIGLYGCKSTPKEKEEPAVVEEVEAVEEVEEVDTTEAVVEEAEVEATVEEEEEE
ncbi:MAG: hypothetical protein IIB05_06410 [Bacteroidetes bacterium]|nr:hypothetical protein [Bacteroidota bacterium]